MHEEVRLQQEEKLQTLKVSKEQDIYDGVQLCEGKTSVRCEHISEMTQMSIPELKQNRDYTEAGTGAWGVQQEPPWLLPGLPGSEVDDEGEEGGPSVRPAPLHASPTVVMTGLTRKCAVGSTHMAIKSGKIEVHSIFTDTLPRMSVHELGEYHGIMQQEQPWLLPGLPGSEVDEEDKASVGIYITFIVYTLHI